MGSIRHVFTNNIADGTNTNIVRPSDWNSFHEYTLQDAVSLGGNTSGVMALISAGTLLLAGGSNVTLSQNANSVTISAANAQPPGAYLTTARGSTDAIGLNTAGTNVTWTANSSGLSLNAGGYAGTGFTTTTVAGDVVAGTNNTAGLKLAVPAYLTTAALSNHSHGNPQLNLTNLSGTTASNSAGFTLSLSASPPGGGAQTGISGVGASDTTYTSGTVIWSGQNNITIGSSVNGASQYVRLSVGPYITTARRSTDALGLATAQTNVTWTANSDGLSLNAGGYAGTGFTSTTTAGVDVKATNNTAGLSMAVPVYLTTAALSNHSHGNPQLNLTNLSGTTASNSAGFTLSLSAAAPGAAQTAISGIVVSDTTYTSGTVSFSNQANVTIGSSVNGATQYIRLSGNPAQTVQPAVNIAVNALTTYTSGTVVFSNANGVTFGTAGQTVTATVATNYQPAGAYLTTARRSTDAIGLATAQTNVTWTANSDGLSLNAGGYAGTGFTTTTVAGDVVAGTNNTAGLKLAVPAYLTTAALSNHSHGNPQLNLTNLTGTTASNSAGFTLSLSAAAPGAAVEANPFNLLGANTAGNTTATGSTIGLSGVNLTLSGTNNSQIVISAPATSSVVGVGGITISTAGSTMSISYSGVDRWMHEIMDGERITTACAVTGASFSKRPIFVPFWLDGNALQPNTVRFLVSRQSTEASLNMTMGVGFYSMNNTSSMNLAFSTTNAFSLTTSALWSGVRIIDITGFTNSTHTLSEGRWIMALYVSGSNNSTAVMNLNFMGGDAIPNVGFILAGTNSSAASATNSRLFPMWGVFNATTAAFPAAVANSSVAGGGSSVQADIYAALLEIAP